MTRLLGQAPELASRSPLTVRATVVPAADGYAVRILLEAPGGHGERRLNGRSCERAALATALVASLAIDPEAVAANSTTPSPPPRSPEPPVPVRAPDLAVESPSRRHLEVGAESSLSFGIFPVPALRLSVVMGLSWQRLRYEIAGGYDFAHEALAPGQGSQGARLQLLTVTLRGCFAPVESTFEVDACAAAEAGWFLATGTGISEPQSHAYPWTAVFAEARLVWHLDHGIELRLAAAGGAGLVRPTFEITGSSPAFVYEPSSILGRGSLAALVRFP
jgi:hypothetical protein